MLWCINKIMHLLFFEGDSMNSSQTNGYLHATNTVLEGKEYEDLLKSFLVGVTGLHDTEVVLQTSAGGEIESASNKLLFYLYQSTGNDTPYLNNEEEEFVYLTRDFIDVWHLSFQGENHWVNAKRFEDVIHVYQNRHILRKYGLGIKEISVVEKEKEEMFQLQTKVQLVLLREVKRKYEILNFEAVECELDRTYKNSV